MLVAVDAGLGPYASSSVWLVEDAGLGYGCCSAYLIGLLFTLIVFSLYRAQKDLDDPFSSTEPDAIRWDAWRCELEALGQSSLSLSLSRRLRPCRLGLGFRVQGLEFLCLCCRWWRYVCVCISVCLSAGSWCAP